eukprot:CAMPEP_0174950486 /NCGR_PEP_ID=MMETSP1355-20121228/94206_1 /TAXON_ID=464990 /ORGANISM="Hemiselmis tepida, Strain CCMP443" /LENGTH=69 /DNA_ID=CAMNT_0016198095 /DNA_START=1 /DNA_END=207 /DNA_ORIENTATION=-
MAMTGFLAFKAAGFIDQQARVSVAQALVLNYVVFALLMIRDSIHHVYATRPLVFLVMSAFGLAAANALA